MKNILMATAIAAVTLTACNNETKTSETHATTEHGNMMDSGMQHMDGDHPGNAEQMGTMKNASMNTVMNAYFQVKNALANDDSKAAAIAGKEVASAIANVDITGFSAEEKKIYEEVKAEIKEHGEHIGSNGDKIAHQREHFEMLSKDIYDMVKVSGTNKTVYYTHCPMYNNNKGANWLSEVKEISNPYLGKEMPDCGTIKEELK